MSTNVWNDRERWTEQTELVASYEYKKVDGRHAYFIDRGEQPTGAKVFRIRRYNLIPFDEIFEPEDQVEFFYGLGDEEPCIYNWPAVKSAARNQRIWFCEGERDAETLKGYKIATTIPFGGNARWRKGYTEALADKDINFLPDNDEVGRDHMLRAVKKLWGKAGKLKIVHLPGLKVGGDVSDFFELHGAQSVKELHKAEQLAEVITAPPPPVLNPRALVANAEVMMDELFSDPTTGAPTFKFYRDEFLKWSGSCWQSKSKRLLRNEGWRFLNHAKKIVKLKEDDDGDQDDVVVDDDGKAKKRARTAIAPFKPAAKEVTDVIDALHSVIEVSDNANAPLWLSERKDFPARELFSCANGLLHLSTKRVLAATPEFFNLSASTVGYDPRAKVPERWLTFLKEVIVEPDAIAALQQLFGYLLSADTSQQKLFFFHGDKRSGKGTVGRVLTLLLGEQSVAGPTISSLGEQFGMEPLIPCTLALIGDARITKKTDTGVLVERLLSISGQDTLTIPRKFKMAWSGQLNMRIVILSNEPFGVTDASGALANRFIIIRFPNTFLGKEDPSLTEKLVKELPGVLNWAIEGYASLKSQGCFIQPASGVEEVADLERLHSPVKTFIEDLCELAEGFEVRADDLWDRFKLWAELEGHNPSNRNWFGRNLMAAERSVKKAQEATGECARKYTGIRLRKLTEAEKAYQQDRGAM